MPPDAPDKIEHIVLLMLENRSFDHMLGACTADKPGIDGIPSAGQPRSNSFDGKTYQQVSGASRVLVEDPRHETPHVLAQLKSDNAGKPGGFVADYANAYLHTLSEEGRGEVMKYHVLGALPAVQALAKNFMVCDHWFSSVPGPTWTNRLFVMSGTSLGKVGMPEGIIDLNLHYYDQATIFDRLNEKGIDWRIYYGDVPLSLLLVHQWQPENRARHYAMPQFFKDVATADPKTFPKFSFIEPAYLDPGGNSGHPPHDILAADALIASVYNALRGNATLWASTLFVVLSDEHGGFYDHVMPPKAVPPDHHQDEYTFDNLGVRVPAILASPWLANDVNSDVFDHTSLLKYLIDKWGLNGLTERVANAKTFRSRILATPRPDGDMPKSISAVPQNISQVVPPKQRYLSKGENAIIALSHALETMTSDPPEVVQARSQQTVTGPQSQIDVAFDRVVSFLKEGAVEALRSVEKP